MANKLKSYFPNIRTKAEILDRIYGDPKLLTVFQSWPLSRQEEFLNFCTGVKGIKITYDSFFKEAMNPEYSTKPLDSMLSAFLGFPVHIFAVLPNDSTRISDETSLLITDIVVELEDGSLANVEIQKIGYAFPGERCACYSSDLLLRQYKRVRNSKGDSFSYRDIKNVYLIVLFEESPAELKETPAIFLHRSETVFSSGLKMNLLQKYIFISIDIFNEAMHNKPIETLQDAWLTFLSCDEPDIIIELITRFPEFKPLYETLYRMCEKMEDVMGFWSEELRELDRNTVYYMIDQLQQKVDDKTATLHEIEAEIANKNAVLANKDAQLADKDAVLADKDAALAKKDAQLADKDAALADKDAEIADKDAALAKKDAEIERLKKIIEGRK